jgi:DNA-binding response OmpR family regulator
MSGLSLRNHTRVLVVEDEEHLRRILVRNLEQAGYQVQSAATAAAALPLCQDSKPDVIVLDINLPDATGWDVLRGIAARELPRPGVVVLSAVPPVHTRLIEFGPLTFLQKPFPIQALLRAVERAAEEHHDVTSDSRSL